MTDVSQESTMMPLRSETEVTSAMPSAEQIPEPVSEDAPIKIRARGVSVFYGDAQALKDVELDFPAQAVTYRPVGQRQVDLPALPEPDE